MEQATHKVTPIDVASPWASRRIRLPRPRTWQYQQRRYRPIRFCRHVQTDPVMECGHYRQSRVDCYRGANRHQLADVATFRKFFGLSNSARARSSSTEPIPEPSRESVVENTLDTEWAGAAAPDANVLVVVTKGTATSFGGLLSIDVHHRSKTRAQVMSVAMEPAKQAGLGGQRQPQTPSISRISGSISIFESAGDRVDRMR